MSRQMSRAEVGGRRPEACDDDWAHALPTLSARVGEWDQKLKELRRSLSAARRDWSEHQQRILLQDLISLLCHFYGVLWRWRASIVL